MSRLKQIALQVIGMIAATQNNDYYGIPESRTNGIKFNPDYKATTPVKELREFRIKGKTVMAYSKKDAIKRLNQQKRK